MRREKDWSRPRHVLVIVCAALACVCVPGQPLQYRHANGAEAGQGNAVERSRGAAAAEATEVLRALAVAPDSVPDRARFLHLFNIIFVAEGIEGEPLLRTVPGKVLAKADRFARAGDAAILEALMYASLGWYGRSAEGGEWLNEILWENLVVQPQLTMDILANLPPEVRAQLLDKVYTAPVHDGFDFVAIAAGIRAASIPAGLERDAARILATAEELLPE